MASEELCPDYLKKLDCPADFAKDVDSLLPKLLTDLQNNSLSSYFRNAVSTLLGPLFKSFELENVEVRLLKSLLPCLGRIFSQSLTSIVELLRNSSDNTAGEDVKTTLINFSQVCLHILSGYNDLLRYLLTYETIKSSWIMSLPKSINGILAATFTHCRDSETVYHSFFTTFSEFLTNFFRQGYEVQSNFFKLLENVLSFSCSYEDELCLLTEVLDTIARIGEIVVKLDPKTIVDQWKTYTKLAHKHAASLRPRLDIARPIIFLSEVLQQTLSVLCGQVSVEQKAQSRNVKLGSFLLKIIIKFCEEYGGYLGDCFGKILELLITLNGIAYLEKKKEIISEVKQHIAVGAGPLLRHVLGEAQFIQEFSDSCDSLKMLTSEAKVGLLMLLLSVLKKLPTTEPGVKELWWRIPLIEDVILISNACQYEMKNLTVDGTTAYTCLVSRTAAVVISNDNKSNFFHVEKLLVSCLLQCALYKAVFAQDLLCLLARLTSSEICVKQVSHLTRLIVGWPAGSYNRPEYRYVGTALSRLFALLPSNSRTCLWRRYPPQEQPVLWSWLGSLRSDPAGYDRQFVEDTVKHLHEAALLDSLESYQQVMRTLQVLPICIPIRREKGEAADFSDLSNGLSKLWNSLYNSLLNCADWSLTKLPDWWSGLFNLACRATRDIVPEMSNADLSQVLQVMASAVGVCDSSCKLSTLRVLKAIGDCDLKGPRLHDVCGRTAQLFASLLAEDDPLVKEAALESFSYFAHMTVHEKVVAAAVSSDSCLQNAVASYLKQRPTVEKPLNDISAAADLVYFGDDTFCHTCSATPVDYAAKIQSSVNHETTDERPAKKLKTDRTDGEEIKMAKKLLDDFIALNGVTKSPIESDELKQICFKISDQFDVLKRKMCPPEQ